MDIISARYAKPMHCPAAMEIIATILSYPIILPETYQKIIQKIFWNNSRQLQQAANKCERESSTGICYIIIIKGFYYCIYKLPGLFLIR
jgi:hypothetical protein